MLDAISNVFSDVIYIWGHVSVMLNSFLDDIPNVPLYVLLNVQVDIILDVMSVVKKCWSKCVR